jgi:uncharacterized protein with PIN domain
METNIRTEAVEDVTYVFVVHGCVAEFLPHTACRRMKHFQTANRKIIRCPYCRNAFTTVDEDERVELYQHPKKKSVVYHSAMSCRTCHSVVGIVYAGT